MKPKEKANHLIEICNMSVPAALRVVDEIINSHYDTLNGYLGDGTIIHDTNPVKKFFKEVKTELEKL